MQMKSRALPIGKQPYRAHIGADWAKYETRDAKMHPASSLIDAKR
jgi:hypothetical protein